MELSIKSAALIDIRPTDLQPLVNCARFNSTAVGNDFVFHIPLENCGADVKASNVSNFNVKTTFV